TGGLDYILAVPSIINGDIQDVDLMSIITKKQLVYNNYTNLPDSYKNLGYSMTGGFDFIPNKLVVYSGSTQDLLQDSNKLIFIGNLKQAYSGTIIQNNPTYKEIINTDTISNQVGSITLVNDYITNGIGGLPKVNLQQNSLNNQTSLSPPTYDSSMFQFLGYDGALDKLYNNGSIYSSGWNSNNCDSNSIPVFLVLNPQTFFATGVTIPDNTIYKIGNGTYSLTGNTLPDGFIKLGNCSGLIGESKAGVVFNANFAGGNTSETGSIFLMSGSQNGIIANMTINGNKAGTYKYTNGIILRYSNNNTLDNLIVLGNQSNGIILINSSYNNIKNCNANSNANDGIVLHSLSNYNNLSNLVTYNNNYCGFLLQTSSNYNIVNNLVTYGNTNSTSTDGYGMILHDNSSYNKISNINIYNNNRVGLSVQFGASYNTFSDMTINKYSWAGLQVYSGSNNNEFKDFEIYNGHVGMYIDKSYKDSFNNFHTYNNYARGIYTYYASNNSFNNFLAYNNGGVSVDIEYGNNNYANNTYVFNNINDKYEIATSLRFYTTDYGYINNYYSYNNRYYGCRNRVSTNLFRSGVYKIFGIVNYDTSGCGASPTGNDGTTMNCNWHVKPDWMSAYLGGTCTAGYYTNTYTGTGRVTYTFGSNIGNQIQPKKWDTNTSSFINYGVDGVDYDSTKKVGQW
nr:right-handed parallel beta-helix repeat-containing protein [Candidatus Gracilibacteria bacterium]